MAFSGIITTILGKTATNSKDAGRERRVHHSKSLPLPFTGERLFFGRLFHFVMFLKTSIKHNVISIFKAADPNQSEPILSGPEVGFSQYRGANS